MTRRYLTTGLLIAAVVLSLGRLPRAASDDEPAARLALPPAASVPPTGRFQMTTVGADVLLLDTATGQVWRRSATGASDDAFFGPKIREDAYADRANRLGPTYQGRPLGYWLAMLRDGDKDFREAGLMAIGHFGPKAAAALPDLVDLFMKAVRPRETGPSPERVGWAVARIDPRHDYLRAQLRHKDYTARRAAALVLSSLAGIDPARDPGGERAVTVSTNRGPLDDAEDEVELPGRLPGDREAVPVLIEMLRDREKFDAETTFAEVALASLGTFKEEAAASVPEVRRLLDDPSSSVRQTATAVLALIGPAARDAVPAIRAALKGPDAALRAASAGALGVFRDRDSLPALRALLADESAAVRQGAIRALGAFKDDAKIVVPALLGVVKAADAGRAKPESADRPDDEPRLAEEGADDEAKEAFRALRQLGPAAKLAVPELINLSRSPGRYAAEAHRALRKIAPDEAKKLPPPRAFIPSSPAVLPAPPSPRTPNLLTGWYISRTPGV